MSEPGIGGMTRDEALTWARWEARDEDGTVCWYDERPTLYHPPLDGGEGAGVGGGLWTNGSRLMTVPDSWRVGSPDVPWNHSLTRLPEVTA